MVATRAESLLPATRLTTLEALARISLADSRGDVMALCSQADHLADRLRQHYFRQVRSWPEQRQAEVAWRIIEAKAAIGEARRALALGDMPGAVAWLSGSSDLFERAFQMTLFGENPLRQ